MTIDHNRLNFLDKHNLNTEYSPILTYAVLTENGK